MAGNVNADAFVPQIWDGAILRTLEDNLIARKICKSVPAVRAKGAGDTVYFNGLADPTVGAYTGTITYEGLVSSQVALLIDQQSHYAFKVTDIEAHMANVDLKGSQASRAGFALKKAVDTYIFGSATSPAIVDAGTTLAADATLDSATVLSVISEFGRVLEEKNVQEGNKWLVIPPWVKEKLILAGVAFQINDGINGTGGMAWTKYLDIDLYVSNLVYNSGTAAAPVSTLIGGSYDAIVYEDALMESRAMPLESSFEVGVSGLLVYGAKVIKPAELVKRVCTYAAETAI